MGLEKNMLLTICYQGKVGQGGPSYLKLFQKTGSSG
jgi:hypothetical protein